MKIHHYIFFVLFFCMPFLTIAQNGILEQTVSLNKKNASLGDALKTLAEDYSLNFAFDNKVIPIDKPISLKVKKVPLAQCLEQLFQNSNIQYELIKDQIVIFRTEVPRFTLSGTLQEKGSGEALIGATILVGNTTTGTFTNDFGRYSLTLPEGKYKIVQSYTGYKEEVTTVYLFNNQSLNGKLKLASNELPGVEVVGERTEKEDEFQSSPSDPKIIYGDAFRETLPLPRLLGGDDIINDITTYLPGINSGDESSTGIHVRGGSPGQNLMLMDGVPVYNADHLFGFFSIYNRNAINHAKVYKGGFPARYGGRLSSVIDIRMKDGNNQKFGGNFTMGLLTTGILLEGPIVKNKTSFLFTARRTWLDLILSALVKASNSDDVLLNYNFYDINMKINHKINDDNKLFLSIYSGDDNFKFEDRFLTVLNGKSIQPVLARNLRWGNKVVALRWDSKIKPKLLSDTNITFSNYNYQTGDRYDIDKLGDSGFVDIYDNKTVTRINDFGINTNFQFIPRPSNHIRFGIGYTLHRYNPVEINRLRVRGLRVSEVNTISDSLFAQEVNAYVEDEIKINDNLHIHPGLHIAGFLVDEKTNISLQPRLSVIYAPKEGHTLKISYSSMVQFIHALTNQGIGLPSDVWVPSTQKVAPEKGDIFSVDYNWDLNDTYSLNLGAYAKWMTDLLQLQDGQIYFNDGTRWEDEVVVGNGRSFGLEATIQKNKGKLKGCVSYTLSKTDRIFPELNDGERFPYRLERTHNLNVVLNYQIMKKNAREINLGAVWIYGSGSWVTLFSNAYNTTSDGNGSLSNNEFNYILQIGKRNGVRLPDYHRLDASISFSRQRNIFHRTWTLGVYNAYGRDNPFDVKANFDDNLNISYDLEHFIGFPLPYVTYNLKF